MKKIYIHIGMPKTGSSAIQAMLAYNEDKLNSFGYTYPWHPGFGQAFNTSAGNARVLAKWISEGDSNSFIEKINSLSHDNIVLSSESLFHTLRTQPKLFSEIVSFFDFTIICYIRKMDDLIDSCINQLVKNHGLVDYDKNMEKIISQHDYSDVLIEASRYIDKDNIIIKLYGVEYFYKGDVIDDFLNTIGLSEKLSSKSVYLPAGAINPSLSPEAIDLRRYLNFVGFEKNHNVDKNRINSVLAKYSVKEPREKSRIISSSKSKFIFESYNDSEVDLNYVFFGKKNRLFDGFSKISESSYDERSMRELISYVVEEENVIFKSFFSKLKSIKESFRDEKFELIEGLICEEVLDSIEKRNRKKVEAILPYDFLSMVKRKSQHTEIEDKKLYTEVTSFGKDPFFVFKHIELGWSNYVSIIMVLESSVDSKAQLRYQTISEAKFCANKCINRTIKKGFNKIEFKVKNSCLNGFFRFDPVSCVGSIKIYSTVFIS